MSKGVHGSLEDYLTSEVPDLLELFSSCGVSHRLNHYGGVTLLVPPDSAIKSLKEERKKVSKDSFCKLQKSLLALVVPAKISWETFTKLKKYVNSAKCEVRVEGTASDKIRLEGGVEVTKSGVSIPGCKLDGSHEEFNNVYKVNKMPPLGSPTNETMHGLVKAVESPELKTGGAEGSKDCCAHYVNILKRYAGERAKGNRASATEVIKSAFVSIIQYYNHQIREASKASGSADSRGLALMLLILEYAPEVSDHSDMMNLANLWALMRPCSSEPDRCVPAEALSGMSSVVIDNSLLKKVRNMQGNLLFNDEASYGTYMKSLERVRENILKLADAQQKLNAIKEAYECFIKGDKSGSGAKAPFNPYSGDYLSTYGLAQLEAVGVESLVWWHQLRNDMRSLANNEINPKKWGELESNPASLSDTPFMVMMSLYPCETPSEISRAIYVLPSPERSQALSQGRVVESSANDFAQNDLLKLPAVPAYVDGGAELSVDTLRQLKAWKEDGHAFEELNALVENISDEDVGESRGEDVGESRGEE